MNTNQEILDTIKPRSLAERVVDARAGDRFQQLWLEQFCGSFPEEMQTRISKYLPKLSL